ncbi:MAG: hypothetical protein IKP66_04770 [Lachnospiraceae bacterium]|nr:hypothetical protein [Lachnospiraceae bacterium]
MKYNIQVLSYLIGSFTEMVNTFGDTPNTAKCFKTQATGLVKINQISQRDLKFVLTLLDILDSNQFDWQKIQQRIAMFNSAMNALLFIESTTRPIAAYELKLTNQINDFVYDKLCEVWEIPKYDNKTLLQTPKNNSRNGVQFGVLNSSNVPNESKAVHISPNSVYVPNKSKVTWEYFWMRFADKYIRVENPNAVCSGDPFYLMCKVKNITTKEAKDIVDIIRSGGSFEVVEGVESGDPCRGGGLIYRRVPMADDMAHSLDFNNIDI